MTIVFPSLLKILCRFLFVNIRPKITSTGNKTALPKLEMAMLLKSADSPFKFVILRRNTILPIDWPVLYSKISQYKKNTILIGANANEREYSKLPLIISSKFTVALKKAKNTEKAVPIIIT